MRIPFVSLVLILDLCRATAPEHAPLPSGEALLAGDPLTVFTAALNGTKPIAGDRHPENFFSVPSGAGVAERTLALP